MFGQYTIIVLCSILAVLSGGMNGVKITRLCHEKKRWIDIECVNNLIY